jgi:hypothetical protein
LVQAGGAWAADKTLDLRVLVVSTGTASADPGLDLMDDVLNEIGVPYDVLDSSTQVLTPGQLSAGDHGFYNGVILTNSELFLPDGSGSGFNFLEWQTLHDFERDFGVRESVLSGFPATNPGLGLDYGMTDIIAGSNFQGLWQAPAGGTEIFEYVNEANPLPITDFAFAGRPFVVYAGEPRDTGIGPHVQPLLVWADDTQKTFVSHIRYDDGREVLYSSISNAWFLIHSQVLAYEFLNFATKGVFIGSREVYLEAHADDLFLGNSMWDPEANATDEGREYRISAAELQNAAAQTAALRAAHPTAAGFTVDFAFNGFGAGTASTPPPASLRPVADTYLEEDDPYDNNGRSSWGQVQLSYWGDDDERTLMRFNLTGQPTTALATATLSLWTDGYDEINAKVCRVTSSWDEGSGYYYSGATWRYRRGSTRWNSSGGDYSSSSCIPLRLRNERTVTVDVKPIVSAWLSGASPNYGLIVIGTSRGDGEIALREYSSSSRRPTLSLTFTPTIADGLTNAVVANRNAFRFVNHTFTHQDMDAGAGIADYAFSASEVQQNRDTWTRLGLPAKAENDAVLVTGEHSGLRNRMGTADPGDDVDYPAGANTALLQAAQDLGVRYLASDASYPSQAAEQLVPGFNLMLLPRYPTAVFYNATTPAENTDEYNYIFHERFVNAGQDPCTIPGAICTPRTYEQVLAAEAETTLRHMLTYRKWPHYFHQSNLHTYNGTGSTLLFDWLDAVLDRYEALLALPVRSLPFHEIGRLSEQRLAARSAGLRGTLDVATGTVTLQADGAATMSVTGLAGGQLYGGQRIRSVAFGTAPQSFTLDPALGQ